MPFAIGCAAATDHVLADRVVVSVWTGEPETWAPENTLTVMFGKSVTAAPPVPENNGVASLIVLPLAGSCKTTFGATAFTVHAT